MSIPTAIKLIALDTGEEYIFGSIAQACDFLQRSNQYIRTGIYDNPQKIVSNYHKRKFSIEVLGIGNRRDSVSDPNRKRKPKLPVEFDEDGEIIRHNEKKQLCWDCARTSGFCSWSQELKPVEGWEAKPTMIRHMSRGGCENNSLYITNSYMVTSCPLFVKDGKTKEERREQRAKLMEELQSGITPVRASGTASDSN